MLLAALAQQLSHLLGVFSSRARTVFQMHVGHVQPLLLAEHAGQPRFGHTDGQQPAPGASTSVYGPCAGLDYELEHGAIDIQLEVWLSSAAQRQAGREATRLSGTNFRHQYWSVAQMVAQHTVGGCNLQPGDILGSGTVSGPTPGEAGAIIELTEGGRKPLDLGHGEQRTFLQDGDQVTLTGWCEKPGYARISFGQCRGEVLPAR